MSSNIGSFSVFSFLSLSRVDLSLVSIFLRLLVSLSMFKYRYTSSFTIARDLQSHCRERLHVVAAGIICKNFLRVSQIFIMKLISVRKACIASPRVCAWIIACRQDKSRGARERDVLRRFMCKFDDYARKFPYPALLLHVRQLAPAYSASRCSGKCFASRYRMIIKLVNQEIVLEDQRNKVRAREMEICCIKLSFAHKSYFQNEISISYSLF